MHHSYGAWHMGAEWGSMLWFCYAAVAIVVLWALFRLWHHSNRKAEDSHR